MVKMADGGWVARDPLGRAVPGLVRALLNASVWGTESPDPKWA